MIPAPTGHTPGPVFYIFHPFYCNTETKPKAIFFYPPLPQQQQGARLSGLPDIIYPFTAPMVIPWVK